MGRVACSTYQPEALRPVTVSEVARLPSARLKTNLGFWWGAAFLTVGQMVLRGWAASGGWFFRDDFWWHDIVARTSMFEAAGLSLGGHYSPLTYVPYWILTATFPYDWLPRVVVMLVTLLGINLGVLAVVRRLWASPGTQLTTYFLWAFSSLAAPSWLWYSQFSMLGALLLTSTWTLWAYLRALATRRTSDSAVAVVLLAISMFAQERMVSTVAILSAFLFLVCRPSMTRLDWTGRGRLWLVSAAVVVLWLLVYLALPASASSLPSPGSGLSIAVNMIRVSALPALLGGPWSVEHGAVFATATTPLLFQIGSCLLIGALILWSVRRNAGAVRAWLILGAGVVADAAAVALVRGGTLGQDAAGDWRYFSDLAVIGPILIVSAFVAPGTRPHFSGLERRFVFIALVGFWVSSLWTSVQLGFEWHQSTSRPVIERIREQLQAGEPVALMDRVMPTTVVNEALLGQRFASRVLSILPGEIQFDVASSDPLWIDDDGALVAADLSEDRRPLLRGKCAYVVAGLATTEIPLTGSLDPLDWGLRIDYSSSSDVRIGVTDFNRTVVVDLPAGRRAMFVPMPGIGQSVGIFMVNENDSLCVDAVVVGQAGPRLPR